MAAIASADSAATGTPTLDVSVLLATRNRAVPLARTLTGFEHLDTRGLTWEVIVVDNGSIDATPQVLAQAAARLPLRALDHPERGKNRALNSARREARGALFVFTDDDVVPEPGWLKAFVRAAQQWPEHDVFAGQIVPRFPDDTPGWLRAHPVGQGAYGRFQLDQGEGPTNELAFGANFAVRLSAAVQPFNETIGPVQGADYAAGSDTEYMLVLRRAGHKSVYVPSACLEHIIEPGQTTTDWLLARSYRHGRGASRLRLQVPDRSRRWFGVPRHLILALVGAWCRYRVSALLDDRRQFDAAVALQYLRGSIHELRDAAGQYRRR